MKMENNPHSGRSLAIEVFDVGSQYDFTRDQAIVENRFIIGKEKID